MAGDERGGWACGEEAQRHCASGGVRSFWLLCVWREWIIIESQINISRISISLTCQSFSSFYLCTEIALGGNDVTFSISSNVLASYEARCYATGSFEELKCNCWGALI